jgi:hypothetical protein
MERTSKCLVSIGTIHPSYPNKGIRGGNRVKWNKKNKKKVNRILDEVHVLKDKLRGVKRKYRNHPDRNLCYSIAWETRHYAYQAIEDKLKELIKFL